MNLTEPGGVGLLDSYNVEVYQQGAIFLAPGVSVGCNGIYRRAKGALCECRAVFSVQLFFSATRHYVVATRQLRAGRDHHVSHSGLPARRGDEESQGQG